MKAFGYPVLDLCINKIMENHSFVLKLSIQELEELVKTYYVKEDITLTSEDIYAYVRIISQELMELQIEMKDEFPPVMNIVKSCSYDNELEIEFKEKAIRCLMERI